MRNIKSLALPGYQGPNYFPVSASVPVYIQSFTIIKYCKKKKKTHTHTHPNRLIDKYSHAHEEK